MANAQARLVRIEINWRTIPRVPAAKNRKKTNKKKNKLQSERAEIPFTVLFRLHNIHQRKYIWFACVPRSRTKWKIRLGYKLLFCSQVHCTTQSVVLSAISVQEVSL